MSTSTNRRHIMIALMARSSPKITISRMGPQSYTYAGTTSTTAAAATPTRNVKFPM